MSSERTRILHVTTESRRIGGAERLLIDLARNAREKAWDLEFVTLRPRGIVNSELEAAGYRSHSLDVESAAQAPRATLEFLRILRRYRPDVVHAHLFHAAILGAIAPARARVLTRHYGAFMERFGNRSRAIVDRSVTRRYDAVIAVSDAVRAQLKIEGIVESRIRTIPNAVDINYLRSLSRESGRARLECLIGGRVEKIVGCVASFQTWKGIDTLVDAFASVRRSAEGCHLVLIGGGPEEVRLRRQVTAAGLERAVTVLPMRVDARELAAGFDVYVQPSREEALGLAVLEAMAMSVPVVATNVGGLAEVVIEGVTGRSVKPDSPLALASAIVAQLDEAASSEMKLRAAGAINERYSLSRLLSDYSRVYDLALRGPRSEAVVR